MYIEELKIFYIDNILNYLIVQGKRLKPEDVLGRQAALHKEASNSIHHGPEYSSVKRLHEERLARKKAKYYKKLLGGCSLQPPATFPLNIATGSWPNTSAANRSIGEVVQSWRRPLLGPSPG